MEHGFALSEASHTPFVQPERSILHVAVQDGIPAHPPHVAPPRLAPSHSSPGSRTPFPQAEVVETAIRTAVVSWLVCVITRPLVGSAKVWPSESSPTRRVFVLGRVWMLVRSA